MLCKMINVYRAKKEESLIVAKLFHKMWNSHEVELLQGEILKSIASDEAVIFIAYMEHIPVGVAQCGLRKDYVEGTKTSPVGYLEGIYIEEEYRNNNIACMLAEACEEWAIEIGCQEFASDCELDNKESLAFHLAIGFNEANRIICFTKQLKK